MGNCNYAIAFCTNCTLNRLFQKYQPLLTELQKTESCEEKIRILSRHLYTFLWLTPSVLYNSDAYTLISAVNEHVDDADLPLMIGLCYATIQGILFYGVSSPLDSVHVSELFAHYAKYIKRYSRTATAQDYANAYCNYLEVRYQFFHLIRDYPRVKREYETTHSYDDIIQQQGQRIVAQYSASMWLGSLTEGQKIKSRDIIETLMADIHDKGILSATDYFITAKSIEHHIQAHTPKEGIQIHNRIINSLQTDVSSIRSSGEAVAQAILYRDIGEALVESGEYDAAIPFFDYATRIAIHYNLKDQIEKIRKKEQAMSKSGNSPKFSIEHVEQFTYIEENNAPVSNTRSIETKCEPSRPDSASSNIDLEAFKPDIEKLLQHSNNTTKVELNNAISAINEKDESKFISALKKAFDLGGNLLTKVAGECLVAYLKQSGIIP